MKEYRERAWLKFRRDRSDKVYARTSEFVQQGADWRTIVKSGVADSEQMRQLLAEQRKLEYKMPRLIPDPVVVEPALTSLIPVAEPV